ncbi:hypothetical protein BDW75DRAFT_238734 [Aspergillus navahoensis]
MWDRVFKGTGFTGVEIDLRDVNVGAESDLYGISNIMSTAVAEAGPGPKKADVSKVVIVTSTRRPPRRCPSSGLSLESPSLRAETFQSKLAVFIGDLDTPVLASLDAIHLGGIKTMTLVCKGLLWITRGGAVECTDPESALASGFVRVWLRRVRILERGGDRGGCCMIVPVLEASVLVF